MKKVLICLWAFILCLSLCVDWVDLICSEERDYSNLFVFEETYPDIASDQTKIPEHCLGRVEIRGRKFLTKGKM